MRNSLWRGTALTFLIAGMGLGLCSLSYAAPGEPRQNGRYISDTGDTGQEAENGLAEMLKKAKAREAEFTGEDPEYIPDSRFLAENRNENDIRVASAAGHARSGEEEPFVFYVIGKNFMPEGSILPVLYGRGMEYSSTLEEQAVWRGDHYALLRFALRHSDGKPAEDPEEVPGEGSAAGGQNPDRRYWKRGDTVIRNLDGVSRVFRCIDQNFRGEEATGQTLALFLCDSVIPADTGAEYVYEQLEDGTFGYVRYPGPVETFGESSEYRDSAVRRWLKQQEEESDRFPAVDVGVESSCLGQTSAGSCGGLDPAGLRFCDMGSQVIEDRYFILSLEEALKYRNELWKTESADWENGGGTAPSEAKGYWLRTPMGDGSGRETGYVYVVDLINGNLHPQAADSAAGIRPAFVLRQEG